ncbi:MAG: AAA family ATPase, partial [Clostridia bacterium]|nr:AAA family ATPase [Clostridia bacterium]
MSETGDERKRIAYLSSDFVETMKKSYFVDKSLLIKEMIDTGAEVTLITRPRRFGKSLNLSMIKTFFEKTEEDNSVYFKDLKIWDCGEKYRSEQGKYPVIHMNLKDPKGKSWEKLYSDIKTEIVREYARHPELDGNVEKLLRPTYDRIVSGTGSESDYNESLRLLSDLLYKYHKVKPVILLDEYDHPIQEAVDGGYYDDAIDFFKPFLSKALKDNGSLSFAVVMGITRVSKEGIFSGLNNPDVSSVLSDEYSQYFGFTDEEVNKILEECGCSKKKSEVRKWYNGYRFGTGRTQIYNPWSVLKYIKEKCKAEAYWVNTSENSIIGSMLDFASDKVVKNLNILLSGGNIEESIDENITYRELYKDPGKI